MKKRASGLSCQHPCQRCLQTFSKKQMEGPCTDMSLDSTTVLTQQFQIRHTANLCNVRKELEENPQFRSTHALRILCKHAPHAHFSPLLFFFFFKQGSLQQSLTLAKTLESTFLWHHDMTVHNKTKKTNKRVHLKKAYARKIEKNWGSVL